MLASFFQPHIATSNLLFIGIVQGLIVSILAMAIVLIYRSTRIINFAVADIGLPAAALLAVMVVRSHFPYWVALVLALLTTTAGGALVEMVVIRRLAKAPRVIVLVATIGVAELVQAIVRTLPDYRTGKFQTVFPTPMSSRWTISSLFHLDLGGFHLQASSKPERTALVSPSSLSHTTRGGAPSRAPRNASQSGRDLVRTPPNATVSGVRRHSPSRRTPGTRFGSDRCLGRAP